MDYSGISACTRVPCLQDVLGYGCGLSAAILRCCIRNAVEGRASGASYKYCRYCRCVQETRFSRMHVYTPKTYCSMSVL